MDDVLHKDAAVFVVVYKLSSGSRSAALTAGVMYVWQRVCTGDCTQCESLPVHLGRAQDSRGGENTCAH